MFLLRSIIPFIFLLSFLKFAHADELKLFLMQFSDAKKYPYHLLDDNYRAYVQTGDNILVLNKQQLKEMYNEQSKITEQIELKNFRILSRSDSENYTSATYQYNWNAKIGNTNMNGVLTSHTTLIKNGETWKVIFDAVTQ